MAEVTITLPPYAPEFYLEAVAWWRRAVGQATSAATIGKTAYPQRGSDAVANLIYFESPELVERAANDAIEQGRSEVAPTLELDAGLVAAALTRGNAIWRGVSDILEKTPLRPGPRIVELREESRAIAERAVAEAARA
jgi:hypothetical protein